jgi:hypothetical protein
MVSVLSHRNIVDEALYLTSDEFNGCAKSWFHISKWDNNRRPLLDAAAMLL